MVTYKRADNSDELVQILELQRVNLNFQLLEEEKEQDGFVTVAHDFETLSAMNSECSHIIAVANSRVIGYALSMHPKFSDKIDILKPMFTEIDKVTPILKDYMVMGQICIAKEYRKKGVFRKLYKTMRRDLTPKYTSIITEVDSRNSRSLSAHYAVGFTLLKSYFSEGRQWELIILR